MHATHVTDITGFKIFDLVATFLWALSGAQLGVKHRYDFIGVFVMAFVSAAGGGLIRDGIFIQNGPPAVLRDWRYIALIFVATLLISAAARLRVKIGSPQLGARFLMVIDAIGIGAYACVGAEVSLAVGLPSGAAILVGTINAVGGALLRDVLVNAEPEMFRPGRPLTAIAVLASAVFVILAVRFQLSHVVAAEISIVVAFLLRILALRLDWRTQPIEIER